MIKLQRGPEPAVLLREGPNWLKALQDAIKKYGSYKSIPDAEKDRLIVNYRHADIQMALRASSHGKCAFCECHPAEGGYMQVEHFKPKAIYPDSTFEWINLLPSCGPCNVSKSNHDTVTDPIINPYDVDPKDAFYFDSISIRAANGPNYDAAVRTIEVCSLESIRLWRPRADILISLTTFADSLNDAINSFEEADTERKKDSRKRRLQEALITIESLMDPRSKFSAFCASFLNNCSFYRKAKSIVNAS
jgi:uncharacterized protein (TIGR02646 family)